MTTSPDPTPNGATHPNPVHGKARQHTDEAILVGGDVPIAAWRLDDRDDPAPAARPGNRRSSRLAQRLILVYTHRGDTIVDLDSDPHLEHASSLTARTYLPITDPTAVADLDAPTDPISLVVLRWPPRQNIRTSASITDLFAACRLFMTTDTCAIAAVSSAAPGQPGTTHAEHLSELLPAAAPRASPTSCTSSRSPDPATTTSSSTTRRGPKPRRHGEPGRPATTDRAPVSTSWSSPTGAGGSARRTARTARTNRPVARDSRRSDPTRP